MCRPPLRSLTITDGVGFIGADLVKYWLERHPEDRVVLCWPGRYPSGRSLPRNMRPRAHRPAYSVLDKRENWDAFGLHPPHWLVNFRHILEWLTRG